MKKCYQASPPCVLVFSGFDPSGGAGLQADITTLSALGCHPLSISTALTVQDNISVFSVHSVDAKLIEHQAEILISRFQINAIKLGITGNNDNVKVIANIIQELRTIAPKLPVILDPVLSNNKGDSLLNNSSINVLDPLYLLTTIITPNFNEAVKLSGVQFDPRQQANVLIKRGCQHVLLKGGHGPKNLDVINRWYTLNRCKIVAIEESVQWSWPRLPDKFHGSGCTLAAALSAYLAKGLTMHEALVQAQTYTQHTLNTSYAIASGQRIPNRISSFILNK